MKEQKPIKIEVEDLDTIEKENVAKPEGSHTDIAEELRTVGKQFAEAVQNAWNSEERQRLENEVKEGFKSFSEELNKVLSEIKTSPAAQKAREEASKVEASEVAHKARGAVASGLKWLSQELSKISDKMNEASPPPAESSEPAEPVEKEPPYV